MNAFQNISRNEDGTFALEVKVPGSVGVETLTLSAEAAECIAAYVNKAQGHATVKTKTTPAFPVDILADALGE